MFKSPDWADLTTKAQHCIKKKPTFDQTHTKKVQHSIGKDWIYAGQGAAFLWPLHIIVYVITASWSHAHVLVAVY